MASKRTLLLIDPQNDFVDLPIHHVSGHKPALPVAGAYADMCRIAGVLRQLKDNQLDHIIVTLDTHPLVAIERPAFWQDKTGGELPAFTAVTAKQVQDCEIVPRDSALLAEVISYLEKLEAKGKGPHILWPEHCVAGTPGAAVVEEVQQALKRWEALGRVTYIRKGQNAMTEHFSAVRAEVPRDDDEATHANPVLIEAVGESTEVYIAGEASSHCVASTVYDLLELALDGDAAGVYLLGDAMSPVAGFEANDAALREAIVNAGGAVAPTEAMLLAR